MSDKTGIEWTDATWNPIRGCSRVSEGCRNCYAETVANRFSGPGLPYEGLTTKGKWNGKIMVVEKAMDQPLRWRKPRKIFVNSMSDLFHENVPDQALKRIFIVMANASQHTFQVLTKRPELAVKRKAFTVFGLRNVWIGTSVENRAALPRIQHLREIPAIVRFLSIEPLLEDLDTLDLRGIHWVIVGGESGRGARPLHPDWVRSIRDQCVDAGVPFFFKQWGEWSDKTGLTPDERRELNAWEERIILPSGEVIGAGDRDRGYLQDGWENRGAAWMSRIGKKASGRILDGRTWDDMPEVG